MSITDILSEVKQHQRPLVLVTGGEPLAQRQCPELLSGLLALGCEVQLETSGAYLLNDVPVGVRKIVDLKTPGS